MNYSKCGAKNDFPLHYFFANLTVLISWIATTASGLAMTVMNMSYLGGESTKLVIQRRYASIKPKNPEN